jgi:hypothetical protein
VAAKLHDTASPRPSRARASRQALPVLHQRAEPSSPFTSSSGRRRVPNHGAAEAQGGRTGHGCAGHDSVARGDNCITPLPARTPKRASLLLLDRHRPTAAARARGTGRPGQRPPPPAMPCRPTPESQSGAALALRKAAAGRAPAPRVSGTAGGRGLGFRRYSDTASYLRVKLMPYCHVI